MKTKTNILLIFSCLFLFYSCSDNSNSINNEVPEQEVDISKTTPDNPDEDDWIIEERKDLRFGSFKSTSNQLFKKPHDCKSLRNHTTTVCTDYESISSRCNNINNLQIKWCVELVRKICCEMPNERNHILDCEYSAFPTFKYPKSEMDIIEVSNSNIIPHMPGIEEDIYFKIRADLLITKGIHKVSCHLLPTKVLFDNDPFPCSVQDSDCD